MIAFDLFYNSTEIELKLVKGQMSPGDECGKEGEAGLLISVPFSFSKIHQIDS